MQGQGKREENWVWKRENLRRREDRRINKWGREKVIRKVTGDELVDYE